MKIQLSRIDDEYKLKAINETGEITFVDGSEALGASQTAFRPMQLLLVSLAGCSAIDVINILKKQRQRIDDFHMEVTGDRKEGVPAPFTKIQVHFSLSGKIKEEKLIKAIELTEAKYCSVYFSLNPEIEITFTFDLQFLE